MRILDSTLREGEQSPGARIAAPERLRIAAALETAGVDVIEAGFPAASPRIAASVVQISSQIEHAIVAAFCRLHPDDVAIAWSAVKHAQRPRLTTCVATSDDHITIKRATTREKVLEAITTVVARCKSHTVDVSFSASDATRTERAFLVRALNAAAAAGATTVVIPDTVGYAQPDEYADLTRYVKERLPSNVALAVHAHDDMGLALANTLAAIRAGADEAHVTVNGIGERAGLCALEELAVTLRVRSAYYGKATNLHTESLQHLSELVATATNMPVAKNKAIVGLHAFMHESGTHQHGVLRQPSLYEIIPAESVGRTPGQLHFGRNSGRSALRARCEELGYSLTASQLHKAYLLFLSVANELRTVDDTQILQIAKTVTGADFEKTATFPRLDVGPAQSNLVPHAASVKETYEIGPDVNPRVEPEPAAKVAVRTRAASPRTPKTSST